jgi:hypothetical protein
MNIKTFLNWLLIAAIITVIFGTIYVTIQQNIRQAANDPQIQLAEDASLVIGKGASPAALLGPTPSVDFGMSLSPFAMVFDSSGKLVNSSGSLNGSVPVPPAGVFDYARAHADDRLTWQPAAGVRIAAVVTYFKASTTGYVLVGRNMREVEKRESQTGTLVLIGWIVSIVASGGLAWFLGKKMF